MTFGYKHHLDRHVKLIHLSERLECLVCEVKFIKRKAFNKHNIKYHGEPQSTQIESQSVGSHIKKMVEEIKGEKTGTKLDENIYEPSESEVQKIPEVSKV